MTKMLHRGTIRSALSKPQSVPLALALPQFPLLCQTIGDNLVMLVRKFEEQLNFLPGVGIGLFQ
ncbi:MAG TPA: hypothetical protein VL978_07815, partial [Puia sp.]|nr:hypothetical protein [Puia sp.]